MHSIYAESITAANLGCLLCNSNKLFMNRPLLKNDEASCSLQLPWLEVIVLIMSTFLKIFSEQSAAFLTSELSSTLHRCSLLQCQLWGNSALEIRGQGCTQP